MTEWYDDDAKFTAMLREGHSWQEWLAARWTAMGLPTESSELRIRPTFTERKAFADRGDLRLPGGVVEVEARILKFTGVADFPFDPVLCGKAASWDGRQTPLAVALISKATRSVVIIPGESRPHWIMMDVFDSTRGFNARSCACPKSWLRSEDEFVRSAIERSGNG